jgi:hypothetical protein
MEEEGSCFSSMKTQGGSPVVVLNIYKVAQTAGKEANLLHVFRDFLFRHIDLPKHFTTPDPTALAAVGSFHQTILKQSFPSAQGKTSRSDNLRVSRVVLSDGTTSADGCLLMVLSPLLEMEKTYQLTGSAGVRSEAVQEESGGGGADDLWSFFEQDASGGKKRPASEGRATTASKKTAKTNNNNKATIYARCQSDGRFPFLNDALRIFGVFMMAVDVFAKDVILLDRQSFNLNDGSYATNNTHISKADKFSTNNFNRHMQSLDEIVTEYESSGGVLDNCGVKLSLKHWYMAKCNPSSGCVWRARYPQDLDHLRDSFDTKLYQKSSLEELEACGNRCHIQYLFHLGALYEHRDLSDSLSRGITHETVSIVFWPHPEGNPGSPILPETALAIAQDSSVAPATSYLNKSSKRPIRYK